MIKIRAEKIEKNQKFIFKKIYYIEIYLCLYLPFPTTSAPGSSISYVSYYIPLSLAFRVYRVSSRWVACVFFLLSPFSTSPQIPFISNSVRQKLVISQNLYCQLQLRPLLGLLSSSKP